MPLGYLGIKFIILRFRVSVQLYSDTRFGSFGV